MIILLVQVLVALSAPFALEGAQGILFYSHGRKGDPFYIRDHAQHWAFVQRLGAELRGLSPVLLSPVANEQVSVASKSINVTLRKCAMPGHLPSTELYLIAANMAHKTPAVDRHFPGVAQADVHIVLKGAGDGQAEVVGSAGAGSAKAGRSLPIRAGVFTDAFENYFRAVYHACRLVSPFGNGGRQAPQCRLHSGR
jgi:hypothetical protein